MATDYKRSEYCRKNYITAWSGTYLKRRKTAAMCLFLCILACLLSGCGDKTEPVVTELGVNGYVYVAEQLSVKDLDSIKGVGDYLYYTQSTKRGTVVKRVLLSADNGARGIDALDLQEAETVFSVLSDYRKIPEEMQEVVENGDYAALFAARGDMEAATTPYGEVMLDTEEKYCTFSLSDYVVDQDYNFYCRITASLWNGFDVVGTEELLCKLNREEQWDYQVRLPSLEIGHLAVDGAGGVVVLSKGRLSRVGTDGTIKETVDTEPYLTGGKVQSEALYGDEEGTIFLIVGYENLTWECMSVAVGDGLKLSKGISGSFFCDIHGVYGGSLYFTSLNDNILFKYDGETSARELLHWEDSDLIGGQVQTLVSVGENQLLALVSKEMYLLTKTPLEELQKKELIVLASTSPDLRLQEIVIDFNRQNQRYHCIIERYGASFGEGDTGAGTRLDITLASSNPPDILDMSDLDLYKYAQKEVLEDLSPYLEGSSQVTREDFLENALNGYTYNDKLLCIPTQFIVDIVVGRANQVGNLESWTMEDVYALTEKFPEQTEMFDEGYEPRTESMREYALKTFCRNYYLEKFIDWEDGACSFDSGEFCRLLEWIEAHTRETASIQTVGRTIFYMDFIPEEALLMKVSTYSFTHLNYYEIQFGEEVAVLGFPTVDGKGRATCKAMDPLGLVANASNKEGAWEFLEYYLSKSREKSSTYLPAWRERLESRVQKVVVSEDSDMVMGNIGIQGIHFNYYGVRQELADNLLSIIEEADFTPTSDLEDTIVSIITEEAESYFNGDKSLEDAAKVIQNRVTLLLQEK